MTTELIDPNAAAKIEAAKDKLRAGGWGGTETVCMMSAMVYGAQSAKDCVVAGWPEWLAKLNVQLFDATVGADDENATRYQFALDVARAVQEPRDYDKAHALFLISRLDTGEHSALKTLSKLDGDWTQQREAIERAVALLNRRMAGEDVAEEMKPAAAAARAAADAATRAAADAAYDAARAAARAAYAATRAAADAAAYAAAGAAACAADAADDAASDAAGASAYAAGAAAYAAARNDLITALRNS